MADMARYRHRVFVEKLGWPLRCEGELEYDEFDRDDTVYVLAQDEEGDVVGTARLLPTTRPYLLAKAFPALWGGADLPCSPEVWELSRFAAADFGSSKGSPLAQFSSRAAIDLLRESIRLSALLGAKKIVTVSPLGVERLLRAANFESQRAGPPISVGGQLLCACLIPTVQAHFAA